MRRKQSCNVGAYKNIVQLFPHFAPCTEDSHGEKKQNQSNKINILLGKTLQLQAKSYTVTVIVVVIKFLRAKNIR